jgi:CheY-like chemotaxis protein
MTDRMDWPPPVLLHVEDNPLDVELLGEALRELGVPHRHLVAENAIQAYSHLRLMTRTCAPSLVVVDLNLPVIHGDTLLRELRSHVPWLGTSLVVLTSSLSPQDHRRALAAGADETMTKPITYEGYLDVARHLATYLSPPPTRRRRLTDADFAFLTRPDLRRSGLADRACADQVEGCRAQSPTWSFTS